MTREERATIAGDLHDKGLSRKQIAKEMRISSTYAHDLLHDPTGERLKARKRSYSKPCPNCGNLMDGSNGNGKRAPKLCKDCVGPSTKIWTRERIIEAIQVFSRENGRPPLATEWLANKSIRDERYPTTSNVYRYTSGTRGGRVRASSQNAPFDTWAEAIEAAGFERPKTGHKTYKRGQGASRVARDWIVLRKAEDGTWEQFETSAHMREKAIANVAVQSGEYFAIAKNMFVTTEVEADSRYALIPSTPGNKRS